MPKCSLVIEHNKEVAVTLGLCVALVTISVKAMDKGCPIWLLLVQPPASHYTACICILYLHLGSTNKATLDSYSVSQVCIWHTSSC